MNDYICPHNCAYRTNSGHCGMTGGYESCQYIKYLEKLEKEKTNINPYAWKRTNADYIRSMSDEELADFIAKALYGMLGGQPCLVGNGFEDCKNRWFNWLNQEVK